MNLKKLSVAALAALTLFSCTKEVEKEVYVDQPEGETYIKIGIDPDLINTKAANDHSGTNASPEELKIYNYAIFIFNAQGILEASLTASPYTNENPIADDYSTNLEFDETIDPNNKYMDENGIIELTAGVKRMFAIVNAPEKLLDVQTGFVGNEGLTQSGASGQTLTFEDLTTIVGEHLDFVNDPSVSGNRGFMMTTVNGFETYDLPRMDDNSSPRPITLKVGRAMAKVSVASDLVLGTPDPTTKPFGDLDVWSYKVINNPKKMNVVTDFTNNVLVTPYYYETSVNVNDYFESSDYVTVSENGAETYTYCIENSNRTPKEGNSTAVIIKGQFRPIEPFVYGGDGVAITDGTYATNGYVGDFWRIKEVAFDTYIPELYYIADPSELPEYKDNPAYEVVKYPNGECYYIFYLKDEVDFPATPYTVKRNKYFMVDIISVNGAGENNDEDLVDPQEPLDPQSYITVNIEVVPWDAVSQQQGL